MFLLLDIEFDTGKRQCLRRSVSSIIPRTDQIAMEFDPVDFPITDKITDVYYDENIT